MPATEALRSYLMSVRHITGADTVSMLLCSRSERHPVFVLHEGTLPPVPELESGRLAAGLGSEAVHPDSLNTDSGDQSFLHCRESSADGGHLLGINIARVQALFAATREPVAHDKRRNAQELPAAAAADGVVWLGLRYADTAQPRFIAEHSCRAAGLTAGTPASTRDCLTWTLALGGYMAWQAYQLALRQQDPVSRLPGRVEFQTCLTDEYEKAVRERHPLGLILVNPDEFGLINHRLGREAGDTALRELAARLSANLRRSDRVFRYGGAVFGVVMPGTQLSAAHAAAEKLRQALTRQPYMDGAARFAFSAGVAVHEPGEHNDLPGEPGDLLRHADQALNIAKLSGGGRSILWQPDGTTTGMGSLDRLSGIFTADTEKDYRNMLLLWDTITVITAQPETETIAREFVDRIGSTFKPGRVGLFAGSGQEQFRLLAASSGKPGADRVVEAGEMSLSGEQRNLLAMAQEHKRTERLRLEAGPGGASRQSQLAYAVPLLARDNCLGCLYLDGPESTLALDTSDLVFLNALASQIAVALDRAELASRWKSEKERESQRLRREVQELRQTLQHTRLVYQSSQMAFVLEILRKVAPTDVTVLITGESGTGKEMLARTLHELSARHSQPFVTVDCGAIAHSLMDAELFGYVKGAYTGAQASSPGRILRAEGGTLFLDEIGEVPLEIQAKLLRFLQEKEITPVGATQSQRVDVRIVAATNRDLAEEVAKGRFREDLYYRLQVVTATAPPLRERPSDILPLAEYFLERFSLEYGKSVRSLDPAATAAFVEYPWPGNVRELQHCILQAVVMSDTEVIGSGQLRLTTSGRNETDQAGHWLPPVENTVPASVPEQSLREMPRPAEAASDLNANPWLALREALERQVRAALAGSRLPVPLGRWLADDLVLAADSAANNTARRASFALGMAETTFRRRLEKVKREFQTGLGARSDAWSSMQPVLSRLLAADQGAAGENIFERARQVLLEEVVARVQQDNVLGSALMGVTAPTYRRWTAALNS